jgi:hypothetical protein
MSNRKARSKSLLESMAQIKKGLTRSGITRSGRPSTSAYAAGGRGGGRGGGGGGGVDFEPLPSASGPVAPELFLEGGPSRDEAETATETESRDEEVHCFPHVHPLFDFLLCIAKC